MSSSGKDSDGVEGAAVPRSDASLPHEDALDGDGAVERVPDSMTTPAAELPAETDDGHPALRAARVAFSEGDNRSAAEALAQVESTEPADVLRERDALQRRLRPDPIALLVALTAFVVVSIVAWLALSRG